MVLASVGREFRKPEENQLRAGRDGRTEEGREKKTLSFKPTKERIRFLIRLVFMAN